jgi:molybdopterin-guanine dinucleotide biosynthesis protein A
MIAGGVVLAGGRSSRMGTPKASLEWHGSTLLHRTAALLRRTVCGPVVVVLGAEDLATPLRSGPAFALPAGVIVVHDPAPGLGPLQGIAVGLAAVRAAAGAAAAGADRAGVVAAAYAVGDRVIGSAGGAGAASTTAAAGTRTTAGAGAAGAAGAAGPAGGAAGGPADAAFVCATDMPFLHPAFVRAVLAALTDAADVALPVARGHRQPLAAAYRVGLAAPVATLLAEGGRTPGELFARCRVTVLDDDALRADPAVTRLDPGLESLTNVNTPAEYAAARARPPELVTVESGGARHTVRAATLARAADAVGARLDASIVLNGERVAPDPHLPLVAGDTLVLR